jgi:hypothetical protein
MLLCCAVCHAVGRNFECWPHPTLTRRASAGFIIWRALPLPAIATGTPSSWARMTSVIPPAFDRTRTASGTRFFVSWTDYGFSEPTRRRSDLSSSSHTFASSAIASPKRKGWVSLCRHCRTRRGHRWPHTIHRSLGFDRRQQLPARGSVPSRCRRYPRQHPALRRRGWVLLKGACGPVSLGRPDKSQWIVQQFGDQSTLQQNMLYTG